MSARFLRFAGLSFILSAILLLGACQCTLSGGLLYLIDSVASDADFTHAFSVPSGFTDTSLTVPRPTGTILYIKLRDDSATIHAAVLPVLPDQFSVPAQ